MLVKFSFGFIGLAVLGMVEIQIGPIRPEYGYFIGFCVFALADIISNLGSDRA